MQLRANRILVRDFCRNDAENLCRIAWEEGVQCFNEDWSKNGTSPQDYYEWIDMFQIRSDSTDVK